MNLLAPTVSLFNTSNYIKQNEKQGILKTQNWKNSFLSFSYKNYKWDNAFKNGPSKICGRQPLNNLK